MPQGSGKSVQGWQRVVENTQRELTLFALSIDGAINEQPYVVGYYYVQLYVNENDPQLMYAKGLLYRSGVIVSLPSVQESSLANLNVWVNWEIPDLNWAAFL